jgi:ferritin-like metal-binding protein YciE
VKSDDSGTNKAKDIMETLQDLLEDELKDLYSAETQLVKALPKLAKKAVSESLQQAFLDHLEETKGQVARLQQIGTSMGIKLTGKTCKAMEGLVEEGAEILEEDGSSAVIDAALIGAAQRVEHYEIAAYGTAKAFAEHLGLTDVVELLEETLQEESAADEKLSGICVDEILPATDASEDSEEDADEGTDKKPAKAAARKKR